jgi:hypothetical protein
MHSNDAQENQPSIVSTVPTDNTTASTTGSLPRAKPKRRFIPVAARCLLGILFLFGLLCSLFPWGRAFVRSAVLLPALLTTSEPAPLQVIGEPIRHTQMTIPFQNGTVYLDIYAPTTPVPLLPHARNGILILPGVGDQRQDPQLVNLSQSLAHSGIVTFDMTTDTLIDNDVDAADSDGVVQAFQALARWPGLAGQHLGIMSFSAGVPLVCFAAADPRIRDDVAYVTAFGGYFNTADALKVVGRRAMIVDGKLVPWQPVPYTLQVLANVVTRTLPFDEQTSIRSVFAPGGTPLSSQEVAQLSPTGRAIYQLLMGSEPTKVDANMAALPPAVQAELAELSPSRVINQIRAPIFLFHDRDDTFLPFTESRDFAAALTRIHHEHDYVEFHIFDHVEVQSHLQLAQLLTDGTHLFGALNSVLQLNS